MKLWQNFEHSPPPPKKNTKEKKESKALTMQPRLTKRKKNNLIISCLNFNLGEIRMNLIQHFNE